MIFGAGPDLRRMAEVRCGSASPDREKACDRASVGAPGAGPGHQRAGSVECRMANEGINQGRRRFLTATTSVVGGAGAALAVVPFVKSWEPSARARSAGAPVEADISKIEPGQKVTRSEARRVG